MSEPRKCFVCVAEEKSEFEFVNCIASNPLDCNQLAMILEDNGINLKWRLEHLDEISKFSVCLKQRHLTFKIPK
jgi:hypothetical protein